MLDEHWACMIVLVRQGRAPPALCFLRKDTYMCCNAKGKCIRSIIRRVGTTHFHPRLLGSRPTDVVSSYQLPKAKQRRGLLFPPAHAVSTVVRIARLVDMYIAKPNNDPIFN